MKILKVDEPAEIRCGGCKKRICDGQTFGYTNQVNDVLHCEKCHFKLNLSDDLEDDLEVLLIHEMHFEDTGAK
jgi:hypothetical protein